MGVDQQASLFSAFTEITIYLMGGSFIVGSLFTILMLLILDFMRRNKIDRNNH